MVRNLRLLQNEHTGSERATVVYLHRRYSNDTDKRTAFMLDILIIIYALNSRIDQLRIPTKEHIFFNHFFIIYENNWRAAI